MAEGTNDFLKRFFFASGTFRRLPDGSFWKAWLSFVSRVCSPWVCVVWSPPVGGPSHSRSCHQQGPDSVGQPLAWSLRPCTNRHQGAPLAPGWRCDWGWSWRVGWQGGGSESRGAPQGTGYCLGETRGYNQVVCQDQHHPRNGVNNNKTWTKLFVLNVYKSQL